MSGTRPTMGPLVDLAALEHRIAQVDAETKQADIAAPVGQSERRYRHLVENSLGLICTHDLEGTVLSVNPAAAHSLGSSRTKGSGRTSSSSSRPTRGTCSTTTCSASVNRRATAG